MKRLIAVVVLVAALGACSEGWDAEPTTQERDVKGTPPCIMLKHWHDGFGDGGDYTAGVYCKASNGR